MCVRDVSVHIGDLFKMKLYVHSHFQSSNFGCSKNLESGYFAVDGVLPLYDFGDRHSLFS